jgi:hypothetical protein
VQTRRPQQRIKDLKLTLEFSDGRKVKKKFPLEEAPILNTIPMLSPMNDDIFASELLSSCTLHAVHMHGNDARYQFIFKKTGAKHVHVASGAVVTNLWIRALWKAACGFFFLVSPQSLVASGRTSSVLGCGGPPVTETRAAFLKPDGKELLLVSDVYSVPIAERSFSRYSSARVFTTDRDEHRFIYCALSILPVLSFPTYVLRIPNVDRLIVSDAFYRLTEGEDSSLTQPLFLFDDRK